MPAKHLHESCGLLSWRHAAESHSSNLQVPKRVSRVPDEILQPSSQWKDGAAFDKSLRQLASLYSANFKK